MNNIIDNNMFNSDENNVDVDIDRIRILEYVSGIDEWENSVLFSENGFYSLKGKEVLGKTEKLFDELLQSLDNVLSATEFASPAAGRVAEAVKSQKLDTVKAKMLEYEEEQKEQYALEVIEKALKLIKNRALQYKFYPEIINKSYFNALSVISLLGELRQWGKKELKEQIERFNSEFFESLVWGYIEEHSAEAEEFFQKNKKYILKEHHEEIEKALDDLKNKLTSFEIAKKFFDENLSEKEALKNISAIKDENIRHFSKIYFSCLNSGRKNLFDFDKEDLVSKVWENIDIKLKENSDEALFEVNLHQDKKVRDSQISYIEQMAQTGKIVTVDKKFFELYKLVFENTEKFSSLNLNNYKDCLSKEDLDGFQSLKGIIKENEFLILKNDYFLLSKYFTKDVEQNVRLIKSFNAEIKEYEKKNKKPAFAQRRTDILEYVKNIYMPEKTVSQKEDCSCK